MSEIPFWKVESVGNDFVLVDLAALDALGIGEDRLPAITRAVSPRRFGIGSDGLLALDTRPRPLRMRMFNPDGSEDFCGNGLRCAARFATTRAGVEPSFSIHHLGREVPVQVSPDGMIQTGIGTASFDPALVPLIGGELFEGPLESAGETLIVSALSTGSTHTILFVDSLPDDETFERLGPAIENHPRFPERTSAIWAVPDGRDTLRIRIWERGAGETQGCGTGSSAAAAAWLRREGRGGTVTVHNPGGTLRVAMDAWDAPIRVEGRARVLFEGTFVVDR
ncbi:MAG: diaminopimelate epimerase [Fimbriimonadaceae bacterium]|nr:diaminopimelate epimerase [Chthonomonadaceae bacterium]MCO5296062.1 diaminopimelate epimerase [Fimbriimonadaceae bacterium]